MYQWTYVYGDTLAFSIVGTKELWVSISLSGFRKTYETWLKESKNISNRKTNIKEKSKKYDDLFF